MDSVFNNLWHANMCYNNNNDNYHGNVYGAVIMTALREFTPVHLMNAD